MGCSSGFTAYFKHPTRDGRTEVHLDFVYHGIGPVDWLQTIEFFQLKPAPDTYVLPEWEAFVPLERLIEYIGPLTIEDLRERHRFFAYQLERREKADGEKCFLQCLDTLAFLAEIQEGNLPEKIKIWVFDNG